jgi:hypothetical protein
MKGSCCSCPFSLRAVLFIGEVLACDDESLSLTEMHNLLLLLGAYG